MKKMKTVWWVALVGVAVLGTSCHRKVELRTWSATDYLRTYKAATLQDLYKYSFQDYFGVGHLITDSVACAAYIRRELQQAEELGGPMWEPLQACGQYVRVNLRAVAEHRVSEEQLCSALLRSTEVPNPITVQQWEGKWAEIMGTLSKRDRRMPTFEADSTHIAQTLAEGHYMMHHSKSFNEAYHYHYRLIRADIFEQELLPLLDE